MVRDYTHTPYAAPDEALASTGRRNPAGCGPTVMWMALVEHGVSRRRGGGLSLMVPCHTTAMQMPKVPPGIGGKPKGTKSGRRDESKGKATSAAYSTNPAEPANAYGSIPHGGTVRERVRGNITLHP